MGKLHKYNIPGHAHFVTTKTSWNKRIFNDPVCCQFLLSDMEFYRKKLRFYVISYCIMPDHLHLIVWWDWEENKGLTIAKIIQSIKGHSAKEIVHYLQTGRRKPSLSPYSSAESEGSLPPNSYQWINKGYMHTPVRGKIWQSSFYDFNIYSDKKLQQKLNYIHWNPVRAGLCKKSEDWLWSSYRFYALGEMGMIKINRVNL